MGKQAWIVLGLAGLVFTGCRSSVDIDGDWNVTLTLTDQNGVLTQAFPGRLELSQVFSDVSGEGVVYGNDCETNFAVRGRAYDAYNIPIELDFFSSTCSDAPFDDNLVVNLTQFDDGQVLYGHNGYKSQLLYVSASVAPY